MTSTIVPTLEELESLRRQRYRKAAEKIQQWSREDREYDERVGEILEQELKDSQLRCEERDEPSP